MKSLIVTTGILVALGMSFALTACGETGASAGDCWNPKLMRVKIGSTVLDLPNGVDVYSSSGSKPDGLLELRFEDWEGNRRTCQRKDRVPLDYGPRARLQLRDRPARQDYINGELFAAHDPANKGLLDFRELTRSAPVTDTDWRARADNATYLSDYREADASVFAGSQPGDSIPTVEIRLYTFTNGPRAYVVRCQVWTDNPSMRAPRPPFPYNCSPGWRFLMGDLVVEIEAQATVVRPEDGQRLTAPPELWPGKWAAVLEEISSYRVDPTGTGQP